MVKVITYFKKFKNLEFNYDLLGDLLNINEADQTYSLISRTNSDNLMQFSLFSFLQQRAFIFILKKLPLHITFNLVIFLCFYSKLS